MPTRALDVCQHERMWQPEPGWERLPAGPASAGTWLAHVAGQRVVVKRFSRPGTHDSPVLVDPAHPAYWRRDVEVARSGVVERTPGLVALPVVEVDEDAEGATVVSPWVEQVPHDGTFLARALGRFATAPLPSVEWLARDQLRSRLAEVARRGGWTTLARTPVADLADVVWRRRGHVLARLDALPRVLQHGDPVPANLRGRLGDDVVAIDWSSLGLGAPGADLGYLALSLREELDPLVGAYLDGWADGWAVGRGGSARGDASGDVTADDVRYAARAVVAFTVLTRVDWALARVAGGEGALAGKFRHPSVAPYIRAMQRHLPEVMELVDR